MTTEADLPADQFIRVPIVEEALVVDKQLVEAARVRVTSTATGEEVSVREHLTSTSVRVERVPVDRLVDVAPLPRTEGPRTILSVTEEVLVRRIRVIEEVHLIRETRTDLHEQTVTLRRLNVEVERTDIPDDGVAPLSTTPNPKSREP